MPIYSVQGPDGRVYDIEGPDKTPDSELIAALEAYLAAKPKPKTGLLADVAGSASNLLNIGRTGIAALTGDANAAAVEGLKREQATQEKYQSGFDPEKIKQALLNIFRNALEAMPEGGAIVIATSAVADHAVITITDTGPGIRESDLPPAIEVALARFSEYRTMEREVTTLQDALETRKAVDRAKGILMDTQGLSETESFRKIQKMSMMIETQSLHSHCTVQTIKEGK